MNAAPVITLDGPSGVGKGTLCRKLARHLGWHCLDSGALYRILALAVQQSQVSPAREAALEALIAAMDIEFMESAQNEGDVYLNGQCVTEAIRSNEISALASQLAAIPAVRNALLQQQRDFRRMPGLVADGRDMGTVVFPHAPLKVFLTATSQERALRRQKQLAKQGVSVNLCDVQAEIEARDDRDSSRAVAPLKPAPDAQILDTTGQTIEQSFAALLAIVNTRHF